MPTHWPAGGWQIILQSSWECHGRKERSYMLQSAAGAPSMEQCSYFDIPDIFILGPTEDSWPEG